MGRAVSNFLSGHFTQYVDYDFTAKLEDELDAVSRGEEEWVPLMERFWGPFKQMVDDKMESVDRSQATGARELGTDPKSGKPVSVRLGRYGPYAAIGSTAEDEEEKPTFASLRPGQSMHTISLEDALELFKLPRKLGQDKDEEVSVGIGRFGAVRQARQRVCLAEEGRRSLHRRPRARGVPDRGEGRDRAQPHHQGVRRQRDPGAQRPLRPLHQRRQAQRPHPQGSRAGFADPGGSGQADGGDRQADAQGFRQETAAKKEPAAKKATAKKAPAKKATKKAAKKATRKSATKAPRKTAAAVEAVVEPALLTPKPFTGKKVLVKKAAG